MSRDFRRQGKMSSRFYSAAGAAVIAATLALSVQTAAAQIIVPVGAVSARLPAGPAAIRRRRSGDADPAPRKPVAAAHRAERGTAISQPPARGSAAAARCRAARTGRTGSGRAARRGSGAATRSTPGPAGLPAAGGSPAAGLSAGAARLRPAAPDRFTGSDCAGAGVSAGGQPPPWRRLRPDPESERSRRAARAGRRPDADWQRSPGRCARRTRAWRAAQSRWCVARRRPRQARRRAALAPAPARR